MKKHVYTERKVKDLIPYANNSRTHSDEQVLSMGIGESDSEVQFYMDSARHLGLIGE